MPPDQIIRCVECATPFVWPAAAAETTLPDRCPMCLRLAPGPGRQRGLVKWFSRAKGYGFITSTQGAEVFLHKSGLAADQPLPRAGQLMEFALSHGPRGVQAEDAVILELTATSPAATPPVAEADRLGR